MSRQQQGDTSGLIQHFVSTPDLGGWVVVAKELTGVNRQQIDTHELLGGFAVYAGSDDYRNADIVVARVLCLPASRPQAVKRQSVEERLSVADRDATMLVGILNTHQEVPIRIQKRQRIWNVVLAGGVLPAFAVPRVGWLLVGG